MRGVGQAGRVGGQVGSVSNERVVQACVRSRVVIDGGERGSVDEIGITWVWRCDGGGSVR